MWADKDSGVKREGWDEPAGCIAQNFLLVQTKMSWRSLLASRYSR